MSKDKENIGSENPIQESLQKIKDQFNKCRSKGEKFSSWNPYSDQGISDEFYTNELVEPDNKKPSMDEIAGVWDEENENPTPHPWEK